MNRTRLIHVGISFLVLAAALGAYGFWWTVVSHTSAQASEMHTQVTARAEDARRIRAAQEALATIAGSEASVASHFVSTADVVPFLESLESTGSALGAKVEVVSVGADTREGHPALTLSLQITGPFDAVVRTLGAIEYGQYDIVLSNLALDTPNASQASPVWTAAAVFSVGTATSTSPH